MTALSRSRLGPIGIWTAALRRVAPIERAVDAAAELDALGYGALWISGGGDGDPVTDAGRLLDGTRDLVVATGVLNLWVNDPVAVASRSRALNEQQLGRFLLGLGVSHEKVLERHGLQWDKPLAAMTGFLDALDAAGSPPAERILAALGPKMLQLAAERSLGAHPFLATVAHTEQAREALGPAAILAPAVMIVHEADPARARDIARAHVAPYLSFPNYARSLLRSGWFEDDLAGGGSDRLITSLVACGDLADIDKRIKEFWAAGADHVCLNVLTAPPPADQPLPLREWRMLADLVPAAAPDSIHELGRASV